MDDYNDRLDLQVAEDRCKELERALAESRETIEGHRQTMDGLRAHIAEQKARAERLAGAASNVLAHVEGSQPIAGWLRDNDASRTALTEMRAALEQEPQE